jgi:hypothetical protein
VRLHGDRLCETAAGGRSTRRSRSGTRRLKIPSDCRRPLALRLLLTQRGIPEAGPDHPADSRVVHARRAQLDPWGAQEPWGDRVAPVLEVKEGRLAAVSWVRPSASGTADGALSRARGRGEVGAAAGPPGLRQRLGPALRAQRCPRGSHPAGRRPPGTRLPRWHNAVPFMQFTSEITGGSEAERSCCKHRDIDSQRPSSRTGEWTSTEPPRVPPARELARASLRAGRSGPPPTGPGRDLGSAR